MPRKGGDMPEDVAEAGRLAGIIKRTSPSLFEALQQEAKAKGLKLSEYLLQVIEAGRMYEPYKDVDGATIMKVMDILDRLQSYMNQWMSRTINEQVLNQSLGIMQALIQLSDIVAPMIGYKRSEEVQQLVEQVREQARREVVEEMRKRGIVTDVIDKFIEKIVDQVTREAVARLEQSGVIEELGRLVAGTTEETVREVSGEQ